jgi:hypothetical protein
MTDRTEEDDAIEVSFPAWPMHVAADATMGYAGNAKLIAFLNAPLGTEHVGARVAISAPRDGLRPECSVDGDD